METESPFTVAFRSIRKSRVMTPLLRDEIWCMSLVTEGFYEWDKQKSVKKSWKILFFEKKNGYVTVIQVLLQIDEIAFCVSRKVLTNWSKCYSSTGRRLLPDWCGGSQPETCVKWPLSYDSRTRGNSISESHHCTSETIHTSLWIVQIFIHGVLIIVTHVQTSLII